MAESISSTEINRDVSLTEEQLPVYVAPPDSLVYAGSRPDTLEEATNRARDTARAQSEFASAWAANSLLLAAKQTAEPLARIVDIRSKSRQQLGGSAIHELTVWPSYAVGT